ncbi:hypothetical protein, partial [Streptococcus suis]|uniref:hypothetical protein n=1 Tax=Streptococcus suis TaxID=1307 RepID=UPI001EE70B30
NSVDLTSFYSYKTIRTKLKIQCPQGRAGSTPAAGIVYEETLIYQRFFFCFVWRVGCFLGAQNISDIVVLLDLL